MPRTMSSTCVKSRRMEPSPKSVMGLPASTARMKSVMAISGRWRGPYTVKKRSAVMGRPSVTRAMALATSSAPRLVAA